MNAVQVTGALFTDGKKKIKWKWFEQSQSNRWLHTESHQYIINNEHIDPDFSSSLTSSDTGFKC